MKKILTLIVLVTLMATPCTAQQEGNTPDAGMQDNSILATYRKEKTTTPYKVSHKTAKTRRVATRKGNQSLKKENNSTAISHYRDALKADSVYAKAQYNRALSHSRLGQEDSAITYYQKTYKNTSATTEQRIAAHYNAGNIHLRRALAARDTGGYDAQNLRNAIEEYKSALRLDSKNTNAKHNLSLAKQLLRPEQQNGNGGQNQQNKQNQDQQNKQNQDQQNQQNQNQQNKQNQDQQDQQNQDQQKQQNQNQQKQQDKRQQEQHRREAEQMLNAMKNNEQQTMKAVRMKEAAKEQRQGSPRRIEKDW